MTQATTPPAETLVVGGRELFMSFGLLHELLAVVHDIQYVSMISIDPALRLAVLNLVLSERDENGKITVALNLHTLRLVGADIQVIMQWVSEHVLDFFLTAVENNLLVHKKHEVTLGSLTVSGTGSLV